MVVWPIVLITYVGLLMQELDLEFQDSVILAILTGFVKFVVGALVLAVLAHFGFQSHSE
jgi:hypothetical protein